MRLLACADIHGHSERIEIVHALVAEHAPDVLLLAGDLTDYDDPAGSLERLAVAVPVVAASGNMDGAPAMEALRRRGWLVEAEPRTVGGVTFGGDQTEAPCAVRVVHFPPRGLVDLTPGGEHIGSRRVLALLERWPAKLLVCGHVHESPGIVRHGGTLVVNCSMGAGKARGALIRWKPDGPTAELV